MSTPTVAELEARVEGTAGGVDPIARVDALNALAWAMRGTPTPRANELAAQARALAQANDYTIGQARAVRTLAMTVNDADGLETIFELAEEARALFDQTEDHAGRAGSRDFLASLHEFVGDMGGAMEFALSALSIAREIDDPVRQGYALSNVGGILAATGDVDTAVERLREALSHFEAVDDMDGAGAIYSRLCRVFKQAGRDEEALATALKCRQLGEQSANDFLHATACSVMAELAVVRGEPQEAERLYREALDGWQTEIARRVMGAPTQLSLARLLLERDDIAGAEHELRSALAMIQETSVQRATEAEVHEALAELMARKGDHRDAVSHLRDAMALREVLAQRDTRSRIAQVEMRAAVEAARRDAEIQRLKFVELQEMQAKLVEAEKMALLGKLAAGTAHELNNPLGVLQSNADVLLRVGRELVALAQQHGPETARLSKLAAALEATEQTNATALQRVGAIAESFRRFTQLDGAERRPYDVREGLDSALTLLAPAIHHAITLRRELSPVPEIEAWPQELNHAFLTALQMAADSIDGAGTIVVRTRADAEGLYVEVEDDGPGRTEAEVAQLFDVGLSDHGARTQMRLGLSAAYGTMRHHGGDVVVDSTPGRGTRVRFRFPPPAATAP